MTIQELREKRNNVWNAAKAFLETHRNEKGTLSEQDDATYNRMEEEINALSNEIKRLERQEQMEAELNKPVNTPLTSKPGNAKGEDKKTGRAACRAGQDAIVFRKGRLATWNHSSCGCDERG